jgi:signal transduction histidine kinase/ActR/RegA family two-component response regulator
MKLSTRLVLLILGCLLPILTAQVYSQVNLYAERREQLGGLLVRQAELANADLSSIVDGVEQLGILAGQLPEIKAPDGDCSGRLTALQRGLPRYRYLALYAPPDGTLVCASPGLPAALLAPRSPLNADLLRTRDVSIGQIMVGTGGNDRVLPIAVRIPNVTASGEPRLLIAGLSADWLREHVETARTDRSAATASASLFITDRDGAIVADVSRSGESRSAQLPEWLRSLLGRDVQGSDTISDTDGRSYLVGYVPVGVAPLGLAVIEVLPLPELTGDIDEATYQDLLVIVGAACIALMLAWIAGRRFIFQPTEALLQAARRWREGDLGARASLADAGSEFAALSQSFNAMAAGLQAREMERRLQSNFLEAQVAERTRELSESNNRLQVEIAGREKTEAALHQAQKLQAVGQLAGGIAHDFNNMLATVLGNLELMERRVSQAHKGWTQGDTERLLTLIERATGAVQRGGQLTARLLTFSRRQRLAARPTDVNALLSELITLATSTLGRRVQVVPELTDNLWPAFVDPSQVEAAILNLCLNARDAMPEGGRLTISTSNATVEHGGAQPAAEGDLLPGEYVRICISDTGTGMTPDVKARAFDPFFTTKGPSAGSGLGLSQVYGMARQSGGNVTIDSTIGIGTKVTLSLPRAIETDEPVAAPAAPAAFTASSLPAELILIVDDDHAVRQVTVEMARDLGCEVVQAASGEQALALLDKLLKPPRFVLLDYAMPMMNGLQLAQALRERGMTSPIALVTGYAELSEGDIAAGRLAGLLRKPFTIRELQVLLTQLRAIANGETEATVLETGLIDG